MDALNGVNKFDTVIFNHIGLEKEMSFYSQPNMMFELEEEDMENWY